MERPYVVLQRESLGAKYREIALKIMQLFHNSFVEGHSGIYRIEARTSSTFYWPGMKSDIKKYVSECDVCQRMKSNSRRPSGLLQPLSVAERIWEDHTMEFIEGLPKSNGYNGILVVVDRLTKYAHFVVLAHPYTTKFVARLFVEVVIKIHGVPRSIIIDRDRIFISNFWN